MPLPVCNSVVERVAQERQSDAHQKNIREARSVVNTRPRVDEEKVKVSRRGPSDVERSIERENMRLFLRMQVIDRRLGNAGSPGRAAAKLVLGSGAQELSPRVRKGSNVVARLQELRRIDSENRQMLKRLEASKPSVNQTELEGEHRLQQKIMQMRCEYRPRQLTDGCVGCTAKDAAAKSKTSPHSEPSDTDFFEALRTLEALDLSSPLDGPEFDFLRLRDWV